MIGIVLATGVYMIMRNCVPYYRIDTRNIEVTAVLLLLLYGSKYVMKKKISPILLIVVSAVIGIAVF